MGVRKRARETPALAPAAFAQAVLAGLAAGESAAGEPMAVEQVAPDGSVSMLQLPDSPHGRAAFALKRHFGDDEAAFRAALARFRALMDLFSRGALKRWCRQQDGERAALHPAVIDVASQMRLSDNGHFPPRKFEDAVREAARLHYPHLRHGWGSGGIAPQAAETD